MCKKVMHYKRYQHWNRKGDVFVVCVDEETTPLSLVFGNSGYNHKRTKPKLFYIVFLCLISFSLFLAPELFSSHKFSLLCKLLSLSVLIFWFLGFQVFLILLCFACVQIHLVLKEEDLVLNQIIMLVLLSLMVSSKYFSCYFF